MTDPQISTDGGQGGGQQQQQEEAKPGGEGQGGGGQGGQEQKSWLDGLNLPDDLRQNPSVTKFAASPEGMVRSLVHLQGLFGLPAEQIARLPRPDDAEAVGKFWNTIGRPETPDKYGLKAEKTDTIDQAGLDAFLAHMHKAGPFTPDMAKAAVDWFRGHAQQHGAEAETAFKQAREAATATLKTEWGAAYATKLDAAAEAASRFGGEELGAYLKETGLGDDPRVLKAWAKVAEAMGEPGSPDPGGTQRSKPGVMTPAEAEAELAKFNTPETVENKAVFDASHPQHAYYVKRRNELFALKRGSSAG